MIENTTPLLGDGIETNPKNAKDIPMEEIDLDNEIVYEMEKTIEELDNEVSIEEIDLDGEGPVFYPVDTMDKNELLKYNYMDKNGLAIINMNIFQQMARRKVLNMLKIPIILFCFGISAIISAFEQSWLITTISCLGIILTCIEYRWELKNFKNFHEFALKFWHSSFVWKKNNRPPLPKYHEYNPKLFTAKKGVSHPRPTQLEIAKIRINEEYDSKIYLIENDFNANGYDFDISRNDTEPWRFVKIEELNKERNEKLDNLEKLDEKDCAAEIIASEARLKEFRLDNLYRIL